MKDLLDLKVLASSLIKRYKSLYTGNDIELPTEFKKVVEEINGSAIKYNRFSAIVTTKANLSIYLPNQWFFIAAFFTHFYSELKQYKELALSVVPKERLKELNRGNLSSGELSKINALRIGDKSKEYLIKFITDYDWWGGGKTIDRADYYVSPILNYASLVNVSQAYVAELCAFLAENEILAELLQEKASSETQKRENSIKQVFHQDNKYTSYLTALRTKPFMLLAGISGTGKSRIVRKLAQATTTQPYANDNDRWSDNRPENFELIQVKPNWHNSMDVVGFYSNISRRYEFTPFIEFIVKAWQQTDTPYFLCLDEMNLAPVEEYFAEFLSAIESRSTDADGNYITDPIIKPFKDFGENYGKDVGKDMLKQLFGEADPIDKNPLAVQFYEKGLTLPPNLMVMGTVNMDETTFTFSRKVLDRAMSIEMNEVDYDKFLSGETDLFPLLTDINPLLVKRPQQAQEVKDNVESTEVIAYLKEVNALLDGTPFKLGYRAANEAMLYVSACKDFADEKFDMEKALDEFTLMKILSRIEGDDNRLGMDENDPRVAAIGMENIVEGDEQRVNLLNCLRAVVRKHVGQDTQTEKKIDAMYRTLEREHFVSFWA